MLTHKTMGNPIQWKGIWRVECTVAHCSCQLILSIFLLCAGLSHVYSPILV